MNRFKTKEYKIGDFLTAVFVLFCVALKKIDVQPIGPEGSEVGFAKINLALKLGDTYNQFWYTLTNILAYIAIFVGLVFAVLGAAELFRRKSIKNVDNEILILGAFFVVVILLYILFEILVVNYRPVIIDGEGLEASFPSSHTMLAICVFEMAGATLVATGERYDLNLTSCKTARILFRILAVLSVAGRFLSGVHWATDIFGAILLSAVVISFFYMFYNYRDEEWLWPDKLEEKPKK